MAWVTRTALSTLADVSAASLVSQPTQTRAAISDLVGDAITGEVVAGANVQIVEGGAWAAEVTTTNGVATFKFTVPPGGTAWAKGVLSGTEDITTLTNGVYGVRSSSTATSLGLPTASAGVLEVNTWTGGNVMLTWHASTQPYEVWRKPVFQGNWGAAKWRPGSWWMGDKTVTSATDIDSLDFTAGVYTVWGGSVVADLGLPGGHPQGVLEVFRWGNAGAMQRWTPRPTGTQPTQFFLRSYYDTAWSGWELFSSAGGGGDTVVSSGSGMRTAALAVTLGNDGTVTAPIEGGARFPIRFNAPITRWRLHVADVNPRTGIYKTAASTIESVHIAAHLGDGRASGAKLVSSGGSVPAGGKWVSEWISEPISDLDQLLIIDYLSEQAPYGLVGACWVTPRGQAAVEVPGVALSKTGPFSVWIEAETYATTPVVATIGSSTACGVGATMPVYDSLLSQHCRANKALPVHYASSGESMVKSLDVDAYKWTQYGGAGRADTALYQLGANDVAAGSTLTVLQTLHAQTLELVRSVVGGVVYDSTVFPIVSPTTEYTTVRRAYNAWLAGQRDGARDVFDFSAAVSNDDTVMRPDMAADNVHLNDLGQSAILAAVVRRIGPAAPLYAT